MKTDKDYLIPKMSKDKLMPGMDDEQIRSVLKNAVASGSVEYHSGRMPERLRMIICWLTIGAFCGFVWGFLLGVMAGCR